MGTVPSGRSQPSTGEPEIVDRAPIPHGVMRGHAAATVKLLSARMAERWTLTSLADEVHLSRSQLVRCFDATTGTSPMAFLRKLRVERMARLLASTDLPIAEAARLVGWTDARYASRTFRDYFGVSPSEFRRHQPAPPIG